MNKIFGLLDENWGKHRGLEWLQDNHIQRQDYRNGELNGNACKKVLKKLDKLRKKVPKRLLKFVAALEKFEIVRTSCFGQVLDPNFKTHIANFKKAYEKLGVPMTNKVHVLVAHVPQFCDRTGKSLGFFSEQAR